MSIAHIATLGPQVGDVVPDFSLTDQMGEDRDLASLMGPNGLMPVFSRSTDGRPSCSACPTSSAVPRLLAGAARAEQSPWRGRKLRLPANRRLGRASADPIGANFLLRLPGPEPRLRPREARSLDGHDDLIAGHLFNNAGEEVQERLIKTPVHFLFGKEDGTFTTDPEFVEGVLDHRP